jgi:hypothetical protein
VAIYQRGNGGHIAEREQPEPGSDREKELERLVDAGEGNWSRVEEDAKAPESGGEPKRPAKTDNKAAWVDWAVANDADRAEADAMTKDDLIKAYGG